MSACLHIQQAAIELASAEQGGKTVVVKRLAEQLGVSLATAYKRINAVLPRNRRKRRSDAGTSTLSDKESLRIASLVSETVRKTGTGQIPLNVALEMLRANGEINAGRVNKTTGEFCALSASAVSRRLRQRNVHPAQLAATAPASRLASPHPNYCWQIDASVSRQFYLADDGAHVMGEREFYRGKPQNFVRINEFRLWRYAITDHASGAIEVFYVQGAESASNFLAALIHALTPRSDGTMHGVPRYLMSDPGSAVTAGSTRVFCAALGIELIVNQTGNARAKGQVENANYLVERHFEACLKLRAPVTSITEINLLAQEWARAYNATRIHTRTGMTRRDGWLRITREQLMLAPPVAVLQRLPTSVPKTCTVRDYMIRFGGRTFDLRGLPGGVLNGQRVQVVRNALDLDQTSVRVLVRDADGVDGHFIAPAIGHDSFGFLNTAATIGSEYKAPPETAADAARKEIERLAMDVKTDEEAKAARKAKRLPFGGRIDPMKHLRDTVITPALPRAGRASNVAVPAVVDAEEIAVIRPAYTPRLLGHVELARVLKPQLEALGFAWTPAHYARLTEGWPAGAAEEQLDELVAALTGRAALRAVR